MYKVQEDSRNWGVLHYLTSCAVRQARWQLLLLRPIHVLLWCKAAGEALTVSPPSLGPIVISFLLSILPQYGMHEAREQG
jgi:hypothetical protein